MVLSSSNSWAFWHTNRVAARLWLALTVAMSAACGASPAATSKASADAGGAPTTDSAEAADALDSLDPPSDAPTTQTDAHLAETESQLPPPPGLARQAYGVWDRSGYQSVADYPFSRGQGYSQTWANVNPSKGTYQWAELDAQLAFADAQNQSFSVQISPIGGAKGSSMPAFLFAAGIPKVTDGTYTYAFYLDPVYRELFAEMVQALAHHLRQELPPSLRARIAFVRCDTGATGDEGPYEEPSQVPKDYQISDEQWQQFRLWAFEVYRHAFQDGPGQVTPLLFQDIEKTAYPVEWAWVNKTVTGGFGAKYGGMVRGHHLTGSQQVAQAFKDAAIGSAAASMFSRNEMDQTWSKPFFQLSLGLNMYWTAVEQLHAGLSTWDVTKSCLEQTTQAKLAPTFEFFNQWAADTNPASAGGGFCIFHQGLDSADVDKFPVAEFGGGPANIGNKPRYTAICKAYQAQGAQMDDLSAATKGQVAQRDSQAGFNDAGWQIVPGNYERFIAQIEPEATSKALWRVNGPLTQASHPYDRFARRFDHASGRDTMYFNVDDQLLPTPGQKLQLAVDYLDKGTGQFALQYDAVGNPQKTAATVTKTGSGMWKRHTVEVTDWACGNHGPKGADLMLVNVDADDDIFHGMEVNKLVDVTVDVVGKGKVTARTNAVTYEPVVGTFRQGQRLELAASPEPGWVFTGWQGALVGNNPRPFLFPGPKTHVTATFAAKP